MSKSLISTKAALGRAPAITALVTANLPRYSAYPVKDLLKIRMKDLGIKNVDLQKILGYARPNVIAMIKSGGMKLPEAKVIEVADVLKIDRIFLLSKVIAENSPDLWDVISGAMGDKLVTQNEFELLGLIRAALGGHDVRLAESDSVLQVLMPALKTLFEREQALIKAALNRDDSDD